MKLFTACLLFAFAFASTAEAAAILRRPISGQYRFHASVAADELPYDPANVFGTVEICAYVDDVLLSCHLVDTAGIVDVMLTLPFDNTDKSVRGRSRDASFNESVDSVDFYAIDQTPGNPPVLQDLPGPAGTP